MGLAIAAAIKGYKCIFVMPDKMSEEKIQTLRAFGAKVVVTPTAVAAEDPRSYYCVAKKLVEVTPNSFYANQYHNPDNMEAHYLTTGPEIWEQTDGKVDVTLAGAFALTLVTVVAYPIFKLMTRTEQADYCYVAPDVQLVPDPENGRFSCGKHIDGYTLMQHVPWSSDRVLVMGVKTSEEIRKEAEAFKCPLR
jgi:hypothetical protein